MIRKRTVELCMKYLRLIYFFILVFCFWYSINLEKIFFIEKQNIVQSRIAPMTEFEVESFHSTPNRNITLREAIMLSIEQGKAYDHTPELISISSVNNKETSGKGGKKPNWNSMISLPNAQYRMNVIIENGKLKKYILLDASDDKPIKNQDISVDSDKLINLAIKKYGLKAIHSKKSSSDDYHFQIQRNDEQEPVFIIEGKTKKGKYMEIYFNPFNGKYLGKGIKEQADLDEKTGS